MSRVVSWFSCGAASAVASWFQLQQDPERTVVAYCDLLGDEHPDNVRFLEECEASQTVKLPADKSSVLRIQPGVASCRIAS